MEQTFSWSKDLFWFANVLCIKETSSVSQVCYFVWFTYNEYLDSLKGRSHQAAISFWLVSSNGELSLDMGRCDGGGNGGLRQGRLELVA